jgi:hypothetical protein
MRDIETSIGDAIILQLGNKKGAREKFTVWTPERLKRQLGNFPETNRSQRIKTVKQKSKESVLGL